MGAFQQPGVSPATRTEPLWAGRPVGSVSFMATSSHNSCSYETWPVVGTEGLCRDPHGNQSRLLGQCWWQEGLGGSWKGRWDVEPSVVLVLGAWLHVMIIAVRDEILTSSHVPPDRNCEKSAVTLPFFCGSPKKLRFLPTFYTRPCHTLAKCRRLSLAQPFTSTALGLVSRTRL